MCVCVYERFSLFLVCMCVSVWSCSSHRCIYMCELFLSYIYYMYVCVCMFQVVRELARKRAGEKI